MYSIQIMTVGQFHLSDVEKRPFGGDECKPPKIIYFDMKDFFPIFLDLECGITPLEVTPSCFIHEMELTTQERYKKLINPLRKYKSGTEPNLSPRVFKPSPDIVIFQKFVPGEVYNVTLSIRNAFEVLKPLCMRFDKSEIFEVTYASKVVMTKVAPGMSVSFNVKFCPQEKKDYEHKIEFKTDEESFSVRVMAIGPRPLLDFPDHIHLPPCPVRVPTTKTLIVRNVGEVPAFFSFITERPFYIEPEDGILKQEEKIQVTITCKSSKIGDLIGSLIIRYQTGEELYSFLHASTKNAEVNITEEVIKIEPTFIGLSREHIIKINNKSDHIVNFKWKKYATEAMDEAEIQRLRNKFKCVKNIESKRSAKVETFDVLCHEAHGTVYERIYEDEVKSLEHEDFLFSNSVFIIEPLTGEIWPHSFSDVIISFKPVGAEEYCAEAFCELTGKESRVPLKMQGTGQGPLLKFNLDVLDINYIFISAKHSYEVIVTNKGQIPGTISFIKFYMGGTMTCEPASHYLEPEEYKTFVLTFSSERQGEFLENICFQIEETEETISMKFRGKVIRPTLHFGRKSLDWGEVGIGFPTVRHIVLHNLSIVPVTFNVCVLFDGNEPSFTSRKFARFTTKPALPKHPEEFKIVPNRGTVPARSDVTLQVTLIPNLARICTTAIEVYMWDSQSESVSLPLTYTAKCPPVVCDPTEITIRFCFINYPYNRVITLENRTSISAFVHIVPQDVNSTAAVTYSTLVSQSELKGFEKIQIPLTIMTNKTGKQSTEVYLLVMGAQCPVPCCVLKCNGQGPVLSVDPVILEWGRVQLLEESEKELTLFNDSPIPAQFNCFLAENSPWRVDPESSTVGSAERLKLKVILLLTDTEDYSGKLDVCLVDGKVTSVLLSAKGFGSSIDIDPPISPHYDFGALYSKSTTRKVLKLRNMGKILHQVTWTFGEKHNANGKAPPTPESGIFKIIPPKLDLAAGEVTEVILEAKCDRVMEISEFLHCTVINYKTLKKYVIESVISAVFIEPLINFSKSSLQFRYDICPKIKVVQLEESIDIENLTSLPLNVILSIDYPFTIKNGEELVSDKELYMASCSVETIVIHFDPTHVVSGACKAIEGYLYVNYLEHPNQVFIPVRGEVNVPTIKLESNVIDFGCIPIGTQVCKHTLIQNVSPLSLNYRWYWIGSSIKIQPLEPVQSCIPSTELSLLSNKTDASSLYQSLWDGTVEYKTPSADLIGKEEVLMVISPASSSITESILDEQSELAGETVRVSSSEVEKCQDLNTANKMKIKSKCVIEEGKPAVPATSYTVKNKQLKSKLFPILCKYFALETKFNIYNLLPNKCDISKTINEVLEVIPCYGILKPNSMEYIAISFCGESYVSVEAKALCEVIGGQSEIITIRGMSSNLSYFIDTTSLNFGHQVFCETCQGTITLYNNGYLGFDFMTDTVDPTLKTVDKKYILEAGMLVVEPQSGHVTGKSKVELLVRYFPGISGKFQEQFQLEIGYLVPIIINVEGYGVFPQLYVFLPRPPEFSLPVEIGYTAIANLTPQWLLMKCAKRLSSSVSNLVPISKQEFLELQENNWVCLEDEYYPPVWEIDLAIERIIAYRHVKRNSNLLLPYNTSEKPKTIPELTVPPYLMDFGPVIVNTQVNSSVAVQNFGTVPVHVTMENNPVLIKYGIIVHFPRLVNLPVAASAVFYVTFSPSSCYFSEKEQELNCLFYLEVRDGGRIPIYVRAVVTVPYLTVSKPLLDFGEVKCGECKVMTLILRNEGLVPCTWEALLVPIKNNSRKKRSTFKNKIMNMFSVRHMDDVSNPNVAVLLEVFFHPQGSDVQEMNLKIIIHQNPNDLIIILRGCGLEPHLEIDKPVLNFNPVIPCSPPAEMTFTIKNPCNFPIEFFFSNFDSQIIEEERLKRVLASYYKTDNLLLPVRIPGQNLQKEFYDFYQNLMNDVISKLSVQEQNDKDDAASLEDVNADSQEGTKSRKKSSLGSQGQIPQFYSTTSESLQSSVTSSTPLEPLAGKDPDEVEAVLHEYIEEMFQAGELSYNIYDPIQQALTSAKIPEKEEKPVLKDGVFILFYGAPVTDYVYHAHRAARNLDLIPLNIDQVIFELAASACTMATMKVRDHINLSYADYVATCFPESDEGLEDFQEKDPFDELLKRTKILVSANWKKSHATLRDKKGGGVHSNASSKLFGKHFLQHDEYMSQGVLDIATDLLVDILKQRFQMPDCQAGVVIDGLNSIFFGNAISTLTGLLKAIGNTKYIHFIILHNCFASYVEDLVKKKQYEEDRLKADLDRKIRMLQELGDDDIESLNEEDSILYDKIHFNRQRELSIKIEERLSKIRQEKAKREEQRRSKLKEKREPKKGTKGSQLKRKPHTASTTEAVKSRQSREDMKRKRIKSGKTHTASTTDAVIANQSQGDKKRKRIKSSKTQISKLSDEAEKKGSKTKASVKSTKSSRSSKKSRSGEIIETSETLVSVNIENEAELQLEFETFESDYQEIITLLDNWDRSKGSILASVSDIHSPSTHPKRGIRRGKRLSNSSNVKLSSSPDITKSLSTETDLHRMVIGVPLWIADCSSPEKTNVEVILHLLKESTEIQEAKFSSLYWNKSEESENIVYSQETVPPRRETKPLSGIFTLYCFQQQNDIEQEEKTNIIDGASDTPDQSSRRGKRSLSKRRSSSIKELKQIKLSKSTSGTSHKKEKKSSNPNVEIAKLKSRWLLGAGEEQQYRMKFYPESVGEYSETFTVEVVGWKKSYTITAYGKSDLPYFDLSPYTIFPNVAETKQDDWKYATTYFIDKGFFDFGSVLITKLKEKRLHELLTTFKFSNISVFPLTITFDFEKSTDKVHVFGFEPPILNIEPNCSEQLTVWACPHAVGSASETIVCNVKNNPTVHKIKVVCQGVKPEIQLDTKTISFDYMLLYRKQKRYLIITNKCFSPLLWRFVDVDNFKKCFGLSPTEGILRYQEKHKIMIEYVAEIVQVVNTHLKLEVYDDQGRGPPLITEVISVNAEAADVMLDIHYPSSNENHLDFGFVKMETQCQQSLLLKNRGKYELVYRIVFISPPEMPLPPGFESMLSIEPPSGTVPCGTKGFTVQAVCKPKCEFQIKNELLFKCAVADVKNADVIVAVIPIYVSASTYFSRFKISPDCELNFGVMTIGEKKTMNLCIENAGYFDFTYNITNTAKDTQTQEVKPEKPVIKSPSVKKKLDISDSKTLSRGTGKQRKSSRLEDTRNPAIDVFAVNAPTGKIKVSEVFNVQIECNIHSEGIFSEEIFVHISESDPLHKNSTEIKLMAVGCLPVVNFTDVDSIFQGHFICSYLNEFECPAEIGSHCVYAKEEEKFMFCRVCVGLESTARIRIRNNGLVPCDVAAIIIANSKDPSQIPVSDVFTVKPSRITIAPYSTESFLVTFSPLCTQMYTSTLEITSESGKKEKISITLCGEGNIPQVIIMEPKPESSDGKICVKFFPTFVGQVCVKQLEFKNIGILECRVLVELCNNVNDIFSLYPAEETIPLMKTWEPDKPIQHTTLIDLIPKQSASLEVSFTPNEVGCFTAEIRLSVINNPFENLFVFIYGEAYMEDVTIDEVELPESMSWAQKRGNDPTSPSSHLNFGLCYINKKIKCSFKLTNHSKLDTYRFEWSSHPNILLTPTVGHIAPRTSKDIAATFLSTEPLNLEKEALKCTVAKIKIINSDNSSAAWDDRQNVVKWLEKIQTLEEKVNDEQKKTFKFLEKIIETGEEPENEVIHGTLQEIILFVSAFADFSRYECAAEWIDFENTLMFQTHEKKFTLRNNGIVPLEYKWQFAVHDLCPVRPRSAVALKMSGLEQHLIADVPSEKWKRPSTSPHLNNHSSITTKSHKHILSTLPPEKYLYTSTSKQSSHISDIESKNCSAQSFICKEFVINKSACESEFSSETIRSSDKSTHTWIEEGYVPFHAKPKSGILKADEMVECTVVFTPYDVYNYKVKLLCNILNLDPTSRPLEIIVSGNSLMPYCHFDIKESDYITSGRRNPTLPGPRELGCGLSLDPETRVLEFNVLGIGTSYTKKFRVINPTDQDYTFSWLDVTPSHEDKVSSFQCSTVDGTIKHRHFARMEFTFVAQDFGICESFWNFHILEHNITTPFLLVGNVSEPSVYFLTNHLDLCPTVIGVSTHKNVTLMNNEDVPLSFNFKPDSLYSIEKNQDLSVSPMSGIINPNSDQIVCIEYNPSVPGECLFTLLCNVKKLQHPLQLSIMGYCYKMQPVVTCSDINTWKKNLSLTSINIVDFGSVTPNHPKTLVFNLTNAGKCAFHYGWIYSEEELKDQKIKFLISEKVGFVTPQSRVYCKMILTFLTKSVLKDFGVSLKISQGPEYKLLVQGSATMPQCEFSISEYNFGPCVIQKSDKCFYSIQLLFTNKEAENVVLESSFENKPHMTINFESTVKGKQMIPIVICFKPRETRIYEETLQFNVNGTFEKSVKISGEGVDLKVALQNPKNKFIDFGSVTVGQTERRTIQVVNKCKAPLMASFGLVEQFQKCDEKTDTTLTKVSPSSGTIASKIVPLSDVLRITPNKMTVIAPQKSHKVTFKFSPITRMHPFIAKVCMQVYDHNEPLCVVKGSCVGADFFLDRTILSFGTVVQDCSSELKVVLLNAGDFGSRFSWHIDSLGENFSIAPISGYCSPCSSVTFCVEFHPLKLSHHISCKIICELEKFKPLILTLFGSCAPLPPSKEVIYFSTSVREEDTKYITIYNKTSEIWNLIPQIKGEYFSGPGELNVLPQGMKQYDITYHPLTMTQINEHQGSVFFKLPGGQALIYNMVGKAEPPLSSGKIILEIPMKTTHTELISVRNWLLVPQQFKVIKELVKSEKYDPVYTFTGNDYINVPGSEEREYRLNFRAHRECNLVFKVIFLNENGGEYQFYDIHIKVVKCGPINVITLNTCVRKPVVYDLKLENPLGTNVNFSLSSSSTELQCPSTCTVAPNSMGNVKVEYLPLHPGESTCQLDVNCSELGLFPYKVNLKADPPLNEKPVNFVTHLGSQHTAEVTFRNLTKTKADFECKVESTEFHIGKNVSVLGNSTGRTEVTYEPTTLEGTQDVLTISSITAGKYVFPLIGTCIMPKPVGPLNVKVGSSIIIPFKNPFKATETFSLSVNHTAFIIKNKNETIKPQKEHQINISLPRTKHLESSDTNIHIHGKLVIACQNPLLSHISWIFYLKGVPD